MLTFNRIDHFGQVVPDLDRQVGLLEGLFGFQTTERWEDADARGALLAVPGRSATNWEVLAPAGDGSPWQAFLDGPTGPGVHHVALEVPAVEETREALRKLGIAFEEREGSRIDAAIEPQKRGEGLVFRFATAGAAAACHRSDASVTRAASAHGDAPHLGIVAVDHLCHAYRDRDELARWYERVLGMREVWRTPDGEHEDLADCVLEVPGGQLAWEIIQPVGDESFIRRFLDSRGPAPHHVTFQVADWDAAVAACEHHGIPMFDENQGETGGARWRDAFVHPKHTGGMLVQLFWEERPGVWVRSDKVPSNA
ncbi:MAG: hypothetical protein Kow0010_22450 [Dehalococcoidia bacterium]